MATNKNFEVKNGLSVGGTERISSAGAFAGSLASGVTATTQSAADSSTKIATTAYTDAAITALIGGAPSALNDLNELAAAIADDANYSTTLTTALATKLPLAGGTMTGALIVDAGNSGLDIRLGTDKRVTWSGGIGEIGSTAGFQATNTAGSALAAFGIRASELKFATGSATRLTIDATGNATFSGTVNSAALTVTGNSFIGNSGSHDADARLHVAASDTSPDLSATTPASYTALFSNSDGAYGTMFGSLGSGIGLIQQRRIDAATYYGLSLQPYGGNVGIGATSGEANLVVRDVSDGTHDGGRIGFGIHESGALQMWHATNMSKTAGSVVTDSTASGGDNVTLSSGQLYGPYHTLPRGQYRMCVKMKTTNAAYTGDAARLTLHTSSGTVAPESRIIRGEDFGTNNKWQTFSVPFQVVGAATNAVEFYLFALNSQVISVDYFFIMNDTDSYSTKVYGNQIVDGKVGIGTSNPSANLDIVGGWQFCCTNS